jgi:acyl-CoA dehydrogenase
MTLSITYTDEQHEIFQKAKQAFLFSQEERRNILKRMVQENEFPDQLWKAFTQHNFMGALIPKKYGGLDVGIVGLAKIIEEYCTTGFPNVLPILTQMAIICITRYGDDALKNKFLPQLASGDIKSCIAATEAHSGMNLFAITTFADNRGDHFILNGSKIYIGGADICDYMMCLVRTKTPEEHQKEGLRKMIGFSLLLVDPKTEGIRLEAMPVRGDAGLHPHRITFNNVEVPIENLIGPEHSGAIILFDAANLERIMMGAAISGITRYCLHKASSYAQERQVFSDVPIGQYQAIQHPLADIQIRHESLKLLIEQAATLFDQRENSNEVGYWANCTKYLAARLGIDAVDTAIETLGGKGFNEEEELIHLWDLVRLFKTAPTSNALILNYVAEQKLNLPRSY